VKIFTHNFNPSSNSGPNKFTRTLFNQLIKDDKVKISKQEEADVEFCLIQQQVHKVKPMVLRLDGIWFNSDQDYNRQNAPIKFSYQNAEAVVFQSNFNKKLTNYWFGEHKNSHVIHNAADLSLIRAANANFWDSKFGKGTEVWSCASSWRPHKRLNENIRYFLEFAPKDAILAIAGSLGMDDAKNIPNDKRIILMGELDYMSLLSLYKRSSTFVHLAYLDHCPNVVVDAQAAGCKIVCSSTGGTHEIVDNGIIILEDEWDMKPCELYKPPKIVYKGVNVKKTSILNNKFENCVEAYYNAINGVLIDENN
jgi:glycosyltransferase involved in cell wall biosynthesis